MGKVVLFLVGVTLFVTAVYYFASLNMLTMVAKPSKNTALKTTIPEPVITNAVPAETNPSDNLRSTLERAVEKSIEQGLWDEQETEAETESGKPQENN